MAILYDVVVAASVVFLLVLFVAYVVPVGVLAYLGYAAAGIIGSAVLGAMITQHH